MYAIHGKSALCVKHSPRGRLDVERLLTCKRVRRKSITPLGQPRVFILFIGGPGSGKSYYFEHGNGGPKYGEKYSFLRNHYNGYNAILLDKDICLNYFRDVKRTHMSPLMIDLLEELFKLKKNVVYIGTGKSYKETMKRIRLANDYSYKIHVVFMNTDRTTAWNRVNKRSRNSVNRITKQRFDEIHLQLDTSIEKLKRQVKQFPFKFELEWTTI